MNHCHWQVLPSAPEASAGLPPLLAQLLANRGLTDAHRVDPFLAADERLLHDPYQLPDMSLAVSRTYQALLRGEKMAVYGDFDADGITAAALLVQGLEALGGQPLLYIPHRLEEGHGLHASALERLRQQGVSLVITVDCGVTAGEAVAQAQAAGQDIVITDHHQVLSQLPPALAVVDPYREDSTYPFPDLAGVGLAYKLLQALLVGMGREGELAGYLDLVALGTVADMVVLLGENRYLVKHGLELINKGHRPGLRELLRQAGLVPGSIDAESISHQLGPRLNAAGRIDHALLSYRLLTSIAPDEISELVGRLEECNTERQRLTEEALITAHKAVQAQGPDAPILIAVGENFWAGVVGIVAGHLVQEYHRPALVLEWGSQTCRGSARSIPEFDIMAALVQCQDLLERFGGHPQAAGFSLPTPNLTEFQRRLLEIAQRELEGRDLRPQIVIDAELPLASLDGHVFPLLQRLAPFGKGNPTPTFLSRGVQVVDCRRVGGQGEHLRLKLKQDRRVWPGVGFDLSHQAGIVPSWIDMVYQMGVDNWQGEARLELRLLDFAPAE